MVSGLKDALKKAGFKSSRSENEREKRPRKQVKKIEQHQQSRNFCEVCDQYRPDVERYYHRNPTIDAQWICCQCADLHMIPDETRKTAQSDYSVKKIFRREYGRTLPASEIGIRPNTPQKSGNVREDRGRRPNHRGQNRNSKKNFNR